MSRKHFEAIARAIRECDLQPRERLEVAARLAQELKHFNSSFDRERFITACQP